MSTLERAIALAATVHSGQRDKAGAPYILHPLRMMMKMTTVEERMTAVLHDVVEDCGINLRLLAYEGFPTAVLESVEALTKRSHDGVEEPYEEFIQRTARHPLARVVKLADLEDNMDLSRISHPTARDYARLEKYSAAKEIIQNAIRAGG
jgi:(p)ppGpp synthase/HD superfamily hydrolase